MLAAKNTFMSLWQTNVCGSGGSESVSSSMPCDGKWIKDDLM